MKKFKYATLLFFASLNCDKNGSPSGNAQKEADINRGLSNRAEFERNN